MSRVGQQLMDDRWWPIALTTVGVALLGIAGWRQTTNPATAAWLHRLLELVLIGGAGIGYLYAAHWYRDHTFDTERYPPIVSWILGFGLLFVCLGVISVYIGSNAVRPYELREVLFVAGSVGLFVGLVVGTMHSRSIQHAETAARVEARADALAAEHGRLEALNSLLRHYILNGVTIISGYANQLRTEVPSEVEPTLDTIDERAEQMGTLVEHVGSIHRDRPLEPMRLDPAIESAVAGLAEQHDVAIETAVCGTTVLMDDRFEDALRLLCEAVITTIDDGTLTISCQDDGGADVTVSVRATPASLPDPLVESLFEPISSGIGLEFYIVAQLLDEYGEIRLHDTSDQILRFDITLKSAT